MTKDEIFEEQVEAVLILVVLVDGLWPHRNWIVQQQSVVLILVVVVDGLWPNDKPVSVWMKLS